jgi:23S rRNA (uracil1939-C5)-methyltransferase
MEAWRVTITGMAFRGDGLARSDDQLLFVHGAIPGEEVVAEIVARERRYIRARVREVITPSPQRVEPPCPHFGQCGGCQWQQIAYPAQLAYKTQLVSDQLRRRGSFDEAPVQPALGSVEGTEEPWGYRNQARFSVDGQGRLGFMKMWRREFLPMDHCLLMHPTINEVLVTLQSRCFVRHQLLVRYGVNTGELLINPEVPLDDLPFETGQLFYEEALLRQRFRITGPSFFQTNTRSAERIARLVMERLELTGSEMVVDAYCGVGTFGILLAGQVRRVVGIEESASALRDARYNGRDLDNVTFLQGKTEDLLPELDGPVDAVILDPSRKGCRRKVMDALLRLRPARVVYVSCEPATLARDLRWLADGGYELIEVQPIDQFPQTGHIECVATLHG